MTALMGIVTTQATSILRATPQWTARTRSAEPIPTMEPDYDVGRTDRQMKEGGRKDDDGRVQIRRKAIDRFHLEDLRPHRRDDTPAASRSP